jgi:hypothetical protein
MWLIGALIAAAGTTVYIEFGTVSYAALGICTTPECDFQGLPRSGGEKNYLEFIYRRPKFMMTCAFSVYALITVGALHILRFQHAQSYSRDLPQQTV